MLDGPVTVAGAVRGNLVALDDPVTISGMIGGNVVMFSGRVGLAPGARVGGNLAYGTQPPANPAGAAVGGRVESLDLDEAGPFDFATRSAVGRGVDLDAVDQAAPAESAPIGAGVAAT